MPVFLLGIKKSLGVLWTESKSGWVGTESTFETLLQNLMFNVVVDEAQQTNLFCEQLIGYKCKEG